MTNQQVKRLLQGLHWYFTSEQRLSGGECSVQLETRSTLEEQRPSMSLEAEAMLIEIDQAIARRMDEIRTALPALPDPYMVRWHGETHWWWTGEVPAGITG
jgi:hypothetical protein